MKKEIGKVWFGTLEKREIGDVKAEYSVMKELNTIDGKNSLNGRLEKHEVLRKTRCQRISRNTAFPINVMPTRMASRS